MFKTAVCAFRKTLPILVLCAAGVVFVDSTDLGSGFAPKVFIWVFSVYALHEAILRRAGLLEADSASAAMPGLAFWLVALLFGALVFIPAFLLHSSFGPPANTVSGFLSLLGTILFSAVVVAAILGPSLPAAVAQNPSPLSFALGLQPNAFLPIAGRIIVGPGLAMIVIAAITIGLEELGLPIYARSENGSIQLVGLLIHFVSELAQLFPPALTAAVLSDVYIKYSDAGRAINKAR